jgi:mutator protein MutT
MFGVVGVLERDDRLLLIQRSDLVRAGGMWCFPGGEIERGETAGEAIVREIREELGLEVEAERKLWSLKSDDARLHLEWWKISAIAFDVRMNRAEVKAYKWLTVEEIRAHEQLLPNNLAFLDHYEALM